MYNFNSKENPIQLPGEPWEQHLGEVRQGTLKLKFNIREDTQKKVFFLVVGQLRV